MSKANTRMLEQGIQAPSPAPDLIPAGSTENLHKDWNYERGHITPSAREGPPQASVPSIIFRQFRMKAAKLQEVT